MLTVSGARSASVGTDILFQGSIDRGVKLTVHLHLVPNLRMSGATRIHLLPLYAFMAWLGATLPLPLLSPNNRKNDVWFLFVEHV